MNKELSKLSFEDIPIVDDRRLTGLLPVFSVKPNVYLRGDGTWQPVEEPPVEHEDVHTDNGFYE